MIVVQYSNYIIHILVVKLFCGKSTTCKGISLQGYLKTPGILPKKYYEKNNSHFKATEKVSNTCHSPTSCSTHNFLFSDSKWKSIWTKSGSDSCSWYWKEVSSIQYYNSVKGNKKFTWNPCYRIYNWPKNWHKIRFEMYIPKFVALPLLFHWFQMCLRTLCPSFATSNWAFLNIQWTTQSRITFESSIDINSFHRKWWKRNRATNLIFIYWIKISGHSFPSF